MKSCKSERYLNLSANSIIVYSCCFYNNNFGVYLSAIFIHSDWLPKHFQPIRVLKFSVAYFYAKIFLIVSAPATHLHQIANYVSIQMFCLQCILLLQLLNCTHIGKVDLMTAATYNSPLDNVDFQEPCLLRVTLLVLTSVIR